MDEKQETRGATSGPWRVERLLDGDEDGPEIVGLYHEGREHSIPFPREDAASLIIALCTYLGVTRIESSPVGD
jgi:hypothetical protein